MGTFLHCWWELKKVQPLLKTVCQLLSKLNRIAKRPSNSTPRYIFERFRNICSHKYLCFWTTQMSVNLRIDEKMWYIHTMEHYSAIKMMYVLIHNTMWMNLKNIMLSESSQTQEVTHCMI